MYRPLGREELLSWWGLLTVIPRCSSSCLVRCGGGVRYLQDGGAGPLVRLWESGSCSTEAPRVYLLGPLLLTVWCVFALFQCQNCGAGYSSWLSWRLLCLKSLWEELEDPAIRKIPVVWDTSVMGMVFL